MPETCCVPCCRSNYKPTKKELQSSSGAKIEYVPVFRFPGELELKQTWIRKINRQNFNYTTKSVVCVKHFRETDIIRREDSRKLQLKSDAVPSVFPGQPKYFTVAVSTSSRSNPEERRADYEADFNKKYDEWLNEDIIPTYDAFRENVRSKVSLNGKWGIHVDSSKTILYTFNFDEAIPRIETSIKITVDLSIEICQNGNIIPTKELQ